jgi:hypothetical protein
MRCPHHITIFEFYGILPSMKFIVRKFTNHIGEKTQTVAATWRKYQLEYITSSLEQVERALLGSNAVLATICAERSGPVPELTLS